MMWLCENRQINEISIILFKNGIQIILILRQYKNNMSNNSVDECYFLLAIPFLQNNRELCSNLLHSIRKKYSRFVIEFVLHLD